MRFNAPPGWPPTPDCWEPQADWAPDPTWPPAPPGWQFWTEDGSPSKSEPTTGTQPSAQQAPGNARRRIWIPVAAAVVALSGLAILAFVYFKGPDTTEMPFAGLDTPEGLAVDKSGNVYVADLRTQRVYLLTAGADSANELPFKDLRAPKDVAVDNSGDVYVIDVDDTSSEHRVLRLESGSEAAADLPISGLHAPTSIAVDDSGTIYVTDTQNSVSTNRLLQLTPGAERWTEIDHPGLEYPSFVTVDASGNLYATDSNRTVAKRPAGSTGWTEIVPDDVAAGIDRTLLGLTTDAAGNVYVVGNTRDEGQDVAAMKGVILKVNPATNSVTETHLKETGFLVDVAVDSSGSLYVTDETNHRVLKVAD